MSTLTKTDIVNNVAANFKHIRLEFEMTQKKMGEKLGLPQKTIAAIEEGRANAAHHVYLMSQYTGIKMDTLFKRRIDLTA